MISTATPDNMPADDLRAIEKRWRRKRIFRQQSTSFAPFLVVVLFMLAGLAILFW